ncbi:MAG: UTP--glucose-1-phosphate uridylyltransferase [Verrucomicrobia bacterium]|nr:UTP--glucose-1-phosphate uridylyltransferase [Verrucomicrobiota bacterium]
MFRRLSRLLLPNPFDRMLKRTKGKRVLLGWNRGLGDIALGLYAMVQRIREIIPEAEITFLIRENLRDGFTLLEGVKTIVAPEWKRGEPYDVRATLKQLKLDPENFDLIVEWPNPTEWVRWQRGRVVPKLKWNQEHDQLWKKFNLSEEFTYIGVQAVAETQYGLWRNWPLERWDEFFALLKNQPKARVVLFGFGNEPRFDHPMIVDLRGKTTLFEMISVIKNRCSHLVLPDSGVLSMAYYLDEIFPIQVVSLWGDPNHGILKQNVRSPNPLLVHRPLVAKERNLSTVSAKSVYEILFPEARPFAPLGKCSKGGTSGPVKRVGCLILAGGQGTRLGYSAPKGMFVIKGETLFERIVKKIPKEVPIAIMTSPLNHEETVGYFEKNGNFGRKISFFQQSMLPLLDEWKRPLGLEGPDGNGSVYRRFVESGIADQFAKAGVDLVTVTPVDNPLAQPLDVGFISFHRQSKCEVTIRCIERNSPEESMGVLVEREGKIAIVEYCEIDPKEMRAVCEGGRLKYLYAYTGLLALDLAFIRRAAGFEMPLHWVRKEILKEGRKVLAWKGERFLFDAFEGASSIGALCSPREECYAPLKNREGPNGIEAVERALS